MCYFFSLAEYEIKLQKRYNAEFEQNGRFKKKVLINGFEHPEHIAITNEFPGLFRFLNWGLIPEWTKSRDDANKIRKMTLNARIETLFEKPAFEPSIKYRRCLVPVDAFYEWQHIDKEKQMYRIALVDTTTFSLAGIWSEWIDKQTGEIFRTFSIITMPANKLMEQIHNTKKRMPVILPPEMEREWLRDNLTRGDVNELAHQITEDRMIATPVDYSSLLLLNETKYALEEF